MTSRGSVRNRTVTILVVLAVLWAGGCGGGGGSSDQAARQGGGTGSLRLSVSGTSGTEGLRVDGDRALLQISPGGATSLRIAILDAARQPVVAQVVIPLETSEPRTVTVSEIPFGTWRLLIEARDPAGLVLRRFEADVTIAPGEETRVSAILTPVASPSASPTTIPSPAPQGKKLGVALRGSPDLVEIDLVTLAARRIPNVSTNDGGSTSIEVSPNQNFYYASDNSGDSGNRLQVVRRSDDTVVESVVVGDGPWGIAAHPAGLKVYVSSFLDHDVAVVRTDDGFFRSNLIPAPSNSELQDLALSPDGSLLFAAGNRGKVVEVIDTATETVVHTIPNVGTAGTGGKGAWDLVVSPDGQTLWVSIAGSNEVRAYRISDRTLLETVTVIGSDGKSGARGIDITPDGTRLVVALSESTDLAVVDTATRLQVGTLTTSGTPSTSGEPRHVAIDPGGRVAYMSSPQGDLICVVDLLTLIELATVPLQAGDSPAGLVIVP